MTFSTLYWIGAYAALFQDSFDGIDMKRTGMLYIVTDVAAVYMVPKLPRSTSYTVPVNLSTSYTVPINLRC